MSLRTKLKECAEKIDEGTISHADIDDCLELLDSKRQDILYLQCSNTGINSAVIGMSIIENNVMSDGPDNPDDWPYQSVNGAMKDGWRIIKFPELALLLDDNETYGCGCEFILERWH
ncbi:MAG: hypothetical protein HRT89_11755 [Lentisphaeria bacterium]|nr:hypothetical protein [Lentisphaeria bacterium]